MPTLFIVVTALNNIVEAEWTDCIIDKIFENIEIVKFITTALKSVLKLVKLQSLVAKCCKMQKIQACKICKFCILMYYARKTDITIEKTVYKICKLYRVIFFTFYNISQPNFAILLNLGCSLMLW